MADTWVRYGGKISSRDAACGTGSRRGKRNHLSTVHQMAGMREQTAAAADEPQIPRPIHRDQQAACGSFLAHAPDVCHPVPAEGEQREICAERHSPPEEGSVPQAPSRPDVQQPGASVRNRPAGCLLFLCHLPQLSGENGHRGRTAGDGLRVRRERWVW